jgi:hypothetical protein
MSKRTRSDGAATSDRISLDVGGTLFKTTQGTLAGHSSYFRRMFSSGASWAETDGGDVLFLDRDPDAFRNLLTYMRNGNLQSMLPRDDPTLCARILLEAEFFGIDPLLQEVKATARRHMGGEEDDMASAAAAFDAEHGALADALRAGILPSRFFAPEGAARIKQLIPTSTPSECFWSAGGPDMCYRVASLALVERSDGSSFVDAVCQRKDTMLHDVSVQNADDHDKHPDPFFLASFDPRAAGKRCRLGDNARDVEYKFWHHDPDDDHRIEESHIEEAVENGWRIKHVIKNANEDISFLMERPRLDPNDPATDGM